MADARMQRLGGLLGPVLVDEASPTEASRISRRAASAAVRPARSLPRLASTSGTASVPAATTPSGAADTGLAAPAR